MFESFTISPAPRQARQSLRFPSSIRRFTHMNSDCSHSLPAPASPALFRFLSLYRFQGSLASDFGVFPRSTQVLLYQIQRRLSSIFFCRKCARTWVFEPFSPQYVVFSGKKWVIRRIGREIHLLRYGFSHFDQHRHASARRASAPRPGVVAPAIAAAGRLAEPQRPAAPSSPRRAPPPAPAQARYSPAQAAALQRAQALGDQAQAAEAAQRGDQHEPAPPSAAGGPPAAARRRARPSGTAAPRRPDPPAGRPPPGPARRTAPCSRRW